ncbi:MULTISPECIES: DUF2163 domain-containing protein [Novosphingobium]|uniref:DUF2163 domain-containing protein n=1 Tax=Novosphingobium TaxID=165696 RepID=UPI001CD73D9D|nr:DUF2163 domain-containing protein [Novosphingobium percolationis]
MAERTRIWFSQPLETAAVWWRIERADGFALGFTTHDRDLWFDGLLHRTAPGMTPSSIRKTGTLEPDSAEIAGALSHDLIREQDLTAGRFDGASIAMGLVDWQTLERQDIYRGTIGAVGIEGAGFSAELKSLKSVFEREIVPRTSPTCRAEFCEVGCTLSATRFTAVHALAAISDTGYAIRIDGAVALDDLVFGKLRALGGPDAGLWRRVEGRDGDWLLLDRPLDPTTSVGTRMTVRQGCDHILQTCAARFANAVNFRGEPFLPGNDLLARYPLAGA